MAPIRDILSNLPDNILDNIFSSLSIRDTVRTSVLSTKWRYKWVSVSHLIFDDESFPPNVSLGHYKLVKIINHVLLIHKGPIQTFKISSRHLQTCSEIDSWIFSLSLHPLREFSLQISESSFYTVLPCLFSLPHLVRLKLICCHIIPPLSFKGFSCLKTLFFHCVSLSNASLKCLLSSCPELEKLTLSGIHGATHLELSNPKLKYLYISGSVMVMCLNGLNHLVYANFQATTAYQGLSENYNFTNNLFSLVSVHDLCFGGNFLQYLTVSDAPRRMLPVTFNHLKKLHFMLNTEDMKEILVAICLLNSSPNLQELQIWFWNCREVAVSPLIDLEEVKDQLESFKELRVVNISNVYRYNYISGNKFELFLFGFILANSPVLETMKIRIGIADMDAREVVILLKKLLGFKRASQQAEIRILD